jgi:hypothetical protein
VCMACCRRWVVGLCVCVCALSLTGCMARTCDATCVCVTSLSRSCHRFDRTISVDAPDIKGREQIFRCGAGAAAAAVWRRRAACRACAAVVAPHGRRGFGAGARQPSNPALAPAMQHACAATLRPQGAPGQAQAGEAAGALLRCVCVWCVCACVCVCV